MPPNSPPSSSASHIIASWTPWLRSLRWLAILGFATTCLVLALYFIHFEGQWPSEREHWGQLGDYVGGMLNPLFGFLALLALLATFKLQMNELHISAKELRKSAQGIAKQNEVLRQQNFEHSFFQLLRLHNDMVNTMEINPVGVHGLAATGLPYRGRDSFEFLQAQLCMYLQEHTAIKGSKGQHAAYSAFYAAYGHEISHYFRMLYNIVKFVARSHIVDKRFYTNLVRAQLSSAERVLLAYSGLSPWGQEKFKPLIEEFALLKNLDPSTLTASEVWQAYNPTAFGEVSRNTTLMPGA